jgi:hypothetical protein
VNDQRDPKQGKDVIAALAELLDLDLLPVSKAEAEEHIREAGINPTDFEQRALAILRDIRAASPEDWRNSEHAAKDDKSIRDQVPLRDDLPPAELMRKIQALAEKLSEHSLGKREIAHQFRNLDRLTASDLAHYLRELEIIARTRGLDTD